MRTNSPFPRNAGRVPVDVQPLPRSASKRGAALEVTAPNVRSEHGAQALRTIEQWLWENSVSTRRRLTLEETKGMWGAMRQAHANTPQDAGQPERELVSLLKDVLHCSDVFATFRPDIHAKLLDFGRRLREQTPADEFREVDVQQAG